MTIDHVQGSGAPRLVQGRRRGPGGVWIAPDETGIALGAAPPEVTASSGIGPMDGLLALQEELGSTERNRAAINHGMSLLAGLGDLQHALLSGGDPTDVLATLDARLKASPGTGDDHKLQKAIGEIHLRVQIELHRHAA